ncbi:hypothetical protein [[Mycoplasma] anseris]|nr:hypothetical protein [[Mycoplasma] anseris]
MNYFKETKKPKIAKLPKHSKKILYAGLAILSVGVLTAATIVYISDKK